MVAGIKVCFVGLGSIAMRHIKNLDKAAKSKGINLEIHSLRHKNSAYLYPELNGYISKTHFDISTISEYDIVFITNPTALHYDTIQQMLPYARNMFIEKPLFDEIHYDISGLDMKNEAVYYVAAPLRYTDIYNYCKNYIKDKSVLSAHIICSSYMPNWQPGRDYRKSFRTRRDMGGGVDLDLIHEIDYMTGLFGFPQRVYKAAGHFSKLEMDAFDIAVYVFEYDRFIIEMHLDYFGASENRRIEIFSDGEVLIGDFLNKTVEIKYFDEKIDRKAFPKEKDHYYDEMSYFFEMIMCNKENINPLSRAFSNLKLAKGVI